MKQNKNAIIEQVKEMNEGARIELADAMDDISSALQYHDMPECAKSIISSSLAKLVKLNFTLTCIRGDLNP